MKKQINIRFIVLLSVITLMGVCRILQATTAISAWANFSPIGAMALFGGAYFSNKYKAYALPIFILFLSDFVLMNTIYAQYRTGWLYDDWYWTYGGFALMVVVGKILIRKASVRSVVIGSFAAAFVHFLLSNFGVWLYGGSPLTGAMYTKDWSGLMSCYLAAIPFFKNLLMGNLVFGTILFGGFELAKSRFPVLRMKWSETS